MYFPPLMAIELEIFSLSLAISDVPTHLIFVPTWEKFVVSDQT
jgi:hypothetical protein